MVDLYDRAKLLDEVWSEPVQAVAPRFGLSDVGTEKALLAPANSHATAWILGQGQVR
jgi:hypothetical protein